MRDPGAALQTAEKIAGIVATVAALVVLNGAWQNQHNWENVSWRVAIAGVLLVLAVIVESHAVELLQKRWWRADETSVPQFLRAGESTPADAVSSEGARVEDAAEVGERR